MNINISKFYTQKLSFGEQEKSSIVINRQNEANKLRMLNERLNSIIREIGGLGLSSDNSGNIQMALAKIQMQKQETQEAWGNCPKALKEKLNRLNSLKNDLNRINDLINEANQEIESKQQSNELILPGNNKDNSELITGMDALAAYNSLKKAPAFIKGQDIKKVFGDSIRQEELENSLKELKKDDWNFEKLNADDSKIYPKLSKQLIIGGIKTTVEKQIKTIDEKLVQLQTEKGVFIPEVGIKVYDPKVTGQILALETAKLRRISVQNPICFANMEQKLSAPDILAQPIPSDSPIFFKIDKRFIPKKFEFQQILKLNEPFKPVLNKLFPDGLNVFMIPGYTDGKMGDIEGGVSVPDCPDKGIWLNSYNFKERYNYTSNLEHIVSNLRGIKDLNPSVLKGSDDRARALAHELSHAISYKLENNYKMENNQKDSQDLLINSGNVSFFDGWKMLRINAKSQYNDKTLKDDARFLTKSSLNNLRQCFEYEAIAEDLRQTFTEENIPAASSMTSIFDQTEEGKEQLSNVKNYIRKCLLEDKSPAEVIFNQVNNGK